MIELARARGIKTHERVIMPEELAEAEEVFITGTAVEVTPIREIDQYSFEVGPITRQLLADYEALVRSEPAKVASAA